MVSNRKHLVCDGTYLRSEVPADWMNTGQKARQKQVQVYKLVPRFLRCNHTHLDTFWCIHTYLRVPNNQHLPSYNHVEGGYEGLNNCIIFFIVVSQY